jgi:hypothetical protein
MGAGRGAFAAVESALRSRSFGTLSTLSEQGRPHATGVVYALSPPAAALALYVTTRSTTRKVRSVPGHRRGALPRRSRGRLRLRRVVVSAQDSGGGTTHRRRRGVDVGEIRCSGHNEFFWFHDLDGNSFELGRPLRLSS